MMTIHNGVDTERFRPGRLARRRGRCAARAARDSTSLPARGARCSSGGEWERKGLRAAIEALAEAPEWALVVAGEGDQARYAELARSLEVAERVRWLGLRQEVAPL